MLQEQLAEFRGAPKTRGYKGPTTYMDHEIFPWNHPTSIANVALETVQHTFMFGIQILAPPGHGKSTLASVVAHHIHDQHAEYDVIWAGGYEFTHQEEFFKGLPKKPHVVIFDDITGVLKQMSGRDVEANFEALTKVRWYLDPATGKIPVIIMTTSHYSKNLEKQIRAQLGMTIFCGFGIEEQSNIDTFTKKGSRAYSTLEQYGTISDKMFIEHQFSMPLPGGKKIPFKTDNPFRCACRLSYSDAQLVVFSKDDQCEKCSKQQYKKYLDPHIVFEKIKDFLPAFHSNRPWDEALKQALVRRGVSRILEPKAAAILDFIEHDLFTTFTTDMDKLAEIYWTEHKKKKIPGKVYHRHKRSNEVLAELEPLAVRIPVGQNDTPDKEIDISDPFAEKMEEDLAEFEEEDSIEEF